MIEPTERSNPWWLWPNLLSLDAPLVALSWQSLFSLNFHLKLTFRLQVALGIGVWMIYVLDRCLDVWQKPPEQLKTARHRFYCRYWRPMLFLAVVVGAAMLILASLQLLRMIFISGILLGLLVLGYLFLVQRCPRLFRLTGLKEIIVGLVFAVGVTLNIWISPLPKSQGFYQAFAFFAALCTLNCLIIHHWELNEKLGRGDWLRWVATFVAFGPILVLQGTLPIMSICLTSSGAGLALLAWFGETLPENPRRVLVDAFLLTPLLGLI